MWNTQTNLHFLKTMSEFFGTPIQECDTTCRPKQTNGPFHKNSINKQTIFSFQRSFSLLLKCFFKVIVQHLVSNTAGSPCFYLWNFGFSQKKLRKKSHFLLLARNVMLSNFLCLKVATKCFFNIWLFKNNANPLCYQISQLSRVTKLSPP